MLKGSSRGGGWPFVGFGCLENSEEEAEKWKVLIIEEWRAVNRILINY